MTSKCLQNYKQFFIEDLYEFIRIIKKKLETLWLEKCNGSNEMKNYGGGDFLYHTQYLIKALKGLHFCYLLIIVPYCL